jgi:hypothetical protein
MSRNYSDKGYTIEQRLKDIRDGQTYYTQNKREFDVLLEYIPYDEFPLYLNPDIQRMNDDADMIDENKYWLNKIKEKLDHRLEHRNGKEN